LPKHKVTSTVGFWDTTTDQTLQRLTGHTNDVSGVAVSPDGARITSCGSDHTLRLWEIPSGRELWQRPFEAGNCLAFSRDSRRIVAGADLGLIRVWDVASGNEELNLRGHSDAVQSVAFSADGKRILSGGFDQTIRLWDAETGRGQWRDACLRQRAARPPGPTGGSGRAADRPHPATSQRAAAGPAGPFILIGRVRPRYVVCR
jgi:WD40 repeat protein